MGLVRFVVVFLLGIGAAFGAYATGAMNYFPHGGLPGWFARSRPVVLRVSDDAPPTTSGCQPRYSVENHSSQRVLVLFTPANDQFNTRTASDYGRPAFGAPGYYGSRGYYGSSEAGTPPDRTATPPGGPVDAGPIGPRLHARANIPVEVEPGEEKYVGPVDRGRDVNSAFGRFGAGDRTATTDTRCGDNELVTLQLNDCTTDQSGVCSTASTFSPGGEYNSY